MKSNVITIFAVLACLACGPVSEQPQYQVPPLQNGTPIMTGGEKGLSPMSFGLCYSNKPVGCAYITSEEHPDFFVAITSGMAGSLGLWWCRYDYSLEGGNTVYKEPVRVDLPWMDKKNNKPFANIHVFQDEDKVWLLKLTSKTLSVAEMGEDGNFTLVEEKKWSGLPHISGFDCIRRSPDEIEIAIVCTDGKPYRPETFPGDSQSYYDGAGIYRGNLAQGRLFRMTVDNSWNETAVPQRIYSGDLGINFNRIACVKNKDIDGYIVTNGLGSMKYIPRDGSLKEYVRNEEGNVRAHKTHGAQLVTLPGHDGYGSDLLIGGESAVYTYAYKGLTKDGVPMYGEPAAVLQENAPLYGGSLTVPNVVDWDGDGVLDIVAGNSEGRLLFFKNRGTDRLPDFAMGEEMYADGKPICIRPGYRIVQGPLEGAWGYLCPTVFDWNEDGLPDIILSGSVNKYLVMLNIGTKTTPELAEPQVIRIDNMELFGTWRVRPAVAKVGDDVIMIILDDLNALHAYKKVDDFTVEDAGRVLLGDGRIITGHNDRLQDNYGQRGRAKLQLYDWDCDGDLDILLGSVRRSSYPEPTNGLPYRRWRDEKVMALDVILFENRGDFTFEEPVQFQIDGKDFYLGAHSNAPFACMLGDTSDGKPNLVVGCESGKYFFFEHDHVTTVK